MALKRGLVDEEGNDNPQNQRFKITEFWCKDFSWLQDSPQLENILRKVVREEAEQAVLRHVPSFSRLLQNQAEISEPRKFKLQFEGKLHSRLFTGNRVESEGSSPVEVMLLDALSGDVITDGPLSSLKVEIVVLQGHFKAEQLQDWTQKGFNDKIVPTRHGKRPLLVGESVISLHNGIGAINGVYFTDNSSWVRSKMFRLGAKVVMAEGDQVREAVSTPFEVKDRRGETYQKHKTPSLEDEVWRLHGIAKDGKICKRLADHQVHKVKDLVHKFHTDQDLLRHILGVSPKILRAIVQQATSSFSSTMAPTDSDVPTTIRNLHLQHFSVSAPSQDGPEISMPLNQDPVQDPSMLVDDDSLIADFLSGSYNDGHIYSLNYPMKSFSPNCPVYGQDMFNVTASNWFSIAGSMGEEDDGSLVGCSSNSQRGILPSSTQNAAGSSTLDMAKSKGCWGKIRAVWRILVKHDDATL